METITKSLSSQTVETASDSQAHDQTFDYILEKIRSADFCEEPFKHLEIFDFLSPEHFNAVINSPQVNIPTASNPAALIESLNSVGYELIRFPGCTTSIPDYLSWLQGEANHQNHQLCKGFGIAFRLKDRQDQILVGLNRFFESSIFKETLEEKFGIERTTESDAGLQKYLHGYEITPHPDIRKKALTYMFNVNPAEDSEALEIHTHYLRLKPKKRFIGEFWRYNDEYDRCWVPWDWCDTVKVQRRNNSIVMFSPSWDTIHSIRLNYDHLQTQRTQFYGNLWYPEIPKNIPKPEHEQFDIRPIAKPDPEPVVEAIQENRSGLATLLKKVGF